MNLGDLKKLLNELDLDDSIEIRMRVNNQEYFLSDIVSYNDAIVLK